MAKAGRSRSGLISMVGAKERGGCAVWDWTGMACRDCLCRVHARRSRGAAIREKASKGIRPV
jgi:hypothetical protein